MLAAGGSESTSSASVQLAWLPLASVTGSVHSLRIVNRPIFDTARLRTNNGCGCDMAAPTTSAAAKQMPAGAIMGVGTRSA
eukprot:CAMPEP_0179109720 /NCGR_PEP_ID=MMETSP0796-20121207/51175_1 /TAXON_ID=73915 /ORGANISM="Pyrodinium bahamense, Strain pbaha01" /LENGTH=80 /DNA_ID=CAMNT_0020807839 /DNA_START=289 /DNA_END=527 /DNA_ORIENTATION=+